MAGWKKRLLERVEEAGIKEEKERIKEEEEKMTGWKDLEEEEEGKKKRKATTRGAAIGDAAKMKRSNPCKRTITLMMARIKGTFHSLRFVKISLTSLLLARSLGGSRSLSPHSLAGSLTHARTRTRTLHSSLRPRSLHSSLSPLSLHPCLLSLSSSSLFNPTSPLIIQQI